MTVKEKEYAEQLIKHKGEYVAVKDMVVVASGKTALEVKEKAEELHIEEPVIFGIPSIKDACYFF